MTKAKHILIIRLSAMGDVAMTVPIIYALRNQYPQLRLTVLTKPQFKPLFKEIENVEVFEVQTKHQHKGLFGLYGLARTLRKQGIDAIADLHNVLRSNILKVFLNGLEVIQIDKGRSEKKALISGKIFEQLKPTQFRYTEVFEKLGFPLDLSKPEFLKPAKLTQSIIEMIQLDSKPLIGIAPFAAYEGKTYPLNQMKLVIQKLSQENCKILLFGAPGLEADQLQKIADDNSNVVNIAGRFDFPTELDIISNLQIMVSMDSGNAHLAAMYGVEVITIWGVTHPYAGFYPFNQDPNNALLADRKRYPKIPTSVFGKTLPSGYEKVFETISPEEIHLKIKEILQKKEPHS